MSKTVEFTQYAWIAAPDRVVEITRSLETGEFHPGIALSLYDTNMATEGWTFLGEVRSTITLAVPQAELQKIAALQVKLAMKTLENAHFAKMQVLEDTYNNLLALGHEEPQ